jgi:hypothetical protein
MRAREEARDRALHAELETLKQGLAAQSRAWEAKLAVLTESALASAASVGGSAQGDVPCACASASLSLALLSREVVLWLRNEVQGYRQPVVGAWAGFVVLVALLLFVIVLLLRRC